MTLAYFNERTADLGSIADRANAKDENESTRVEYRMRHFSIMKGNTFMPSGGNYHLYDQGNP